MVTVVGWATGVLTLGNGIGLAIVGMEDAATGEIKFSAVLGDFTNDGNTASVQGEGVALLPIERAVVSASISGQGTDVAPFIAADVHRPDSPSRVRPRGHSPSRKPNGANRTRWNGRCRRRSHRGSCYSRSLQPRLSKVMGLTQPNPRHLQYLLIQHSSITRRTCRLTRAPAPKSGQPGITAVGVSSAPWLSVRSVVSAVDA